MQVSGALIPIRSAAPLPPRRGGSSAPSARAPLALAPLALLLALAVVPEAASALEPRFVLEFATASSDELVGDSGSTFGPLEVSAAIHPSGLTGDQGPQGWSIGVRHDPLLEILQVTTDGTSAGTLVDLEKGFLLMEIIDPARNNGQHGYVATAALPLDPPVYLPPSGASTVVSATYRGDHPSVTAVTQTLLSFDFVDGLSGSGPPVVNTVFHEGKSYLPDFTALKWKLKTLPVCNPDLSLSLDSPGAVLVGEEWRLQPDLPAGQELAIDVTAALSLSLAGAMGPEGWSISVQHDPGFFALKSATTRNTDAERFADPDQRFLKTEIVDGEAGAGFTSAVILSLAGPLTLPPSGRFTIARASYQLAAPHDLPGALAPSSLRYQDGLRGDNPPVQNIFTVEGKTEKACSRKGLVVAVNVVKGGRVFWRGDANNDARINISDPVWLANQLFAIPAASPCPAASDSNGDGRLDTADMIYLLSYLFQAGPSMPAPFRRCGADPRLDDPLPCEELAVRCP
jgi:hypothetical protein